MFAGRPDDPMSPPAAVIEVSAGEPTRTVWRNELGGLTYEIGTGIRRRFVKWAPVGSGLDLSQEVIRLRWAASFSPVPHVLEQGSDHEGSWFLSRALPGTNAVDGRWLAAPATAVVAIGAGLRALHDSLPADRCPFSWSAPDRIADAGRRAALGCLDPARWHESHQHLTVAKALTRLADPPAVDQLVVCHGDACSPNTLLNQRGQWCGHVDFGDLGIADRWADLAVATWSAEWNYGPGWEIPLLDAYGIAPDPERTAYYRLLWDLGP